MEAFMEISFVVAMAFAFASLVAIMSCGHVHYLRRVIYGWTMDEIEMNPPGSNIKKEWHDLSRLTPNKLGKKPKANPLRVIALAELMSSNMDLYQEAKHMTTSFYSQVKYLLKAGKLTWAIAFYLESRKWSKLAFERLQHANEHVEPIDLEVLGAPDFMIAKAPYVGWFIGMFGFKKLALAFLKEADEKLMDKTSKLDPLQAALIWSKLYALTGNGRYRLQTKNVGLNANMDEGQLLRIAKHLGFQNLNQLRDFCTYRA